MKYILLIFILFYSGYDLLSQSTLIELKDHKLSGYIFEGEYQTSFKLDLADERFTPTLKDIRLAEELLKSFDLKSRKSKRSKRRQYLGYINGSTKYLLIHTMYYKCEKQFKEDYPTWDTSFAYLFNEPEEMQKSNLYIVNLSDSTIGYF